MVMSGIVGNSSISSFIVGGANLTDPQVFHDNFFQGTFKVEILYGYVMFDKMLFKTNKASTWRRLKFNANVPSGTSLKLSVLKANGDIIADNITTSPYDISNLVGTYTGNLKIKAEFVGTDVSPILYDVSLGYKPARLGDWTGDRNVEFIDNLNNIFEDPIINDKFISIVSSAAINFSTKEVSLK